MYTESKRGEINVINYIIADDEKFFVDEVENIIHSIMMKNNKEYKVHRFSDYNNDFMNLIINPVPNKIYVLDVEMKSASGIDVARKIRKKDSNSIIIFLTAHEELSSVVSKDQLMALTFICKFDSFKLNLIKAIKKSLQILGQDTVIKIKDCGAIYTIDINDILWITRDCVERKCMIKTNYAIYKVNKSLMELKELGKSKFKQIHRGCLVNEDRITKIDVKNRKVMLDNGEIISSLSPNYKEEIMQ